MGKSGTVLVLLTLFLLNTPCVASRRDRTKGQRRKQAHRLLADEEEQSETIFELELSTSAERFESDRFPGDESCPCLSYEELAPYERRQSKRSSDILGVATNFETYGVNCAPHDLKTPLCSSLDSCTNVEPLPPDCDKSFCQRSFCFVDPLNCSLYHKPSSIFPNIHYSYATCGFMDSFTYSERIKSLSGRVLKVALNANTGGWMGAYNQEGSFATNPYWTGPVVDFMVDAAQRGGFAFNVTQPPKWIEAEAAKFFGNSSFDLCVYATSLGFLDLCIGAYTITDKRASVTPFIELGSDPVYLVTFVDDKTGANYMETFFNSLLTIFQPFTPGSWIMIAFICLPVLGLLMIFHEYGTPGSAFPDTHEVMKTHVTTGEKSLEHRSIPRRQHIPKALYMSYLSFFNGSYDPVVITVGGKINLLAILSFVLLVLAVYTANLAAILTQDASKSPIDSLDKAIRANYQFCASRKVATRIIDLFGVDPGRIVPDPEYLGGDGKPGFNCRDCEARERIFDYMTKSQDFDRSMYCNAALASLEDLQVLHRYQSHCDKAKVGDVLAYRDFGIPIASSVSDELMSWLYQMKYEGVLDRHIFAATPQSQCPEREGEEGIALNVEQLTGIWTVVFGFAFAGLMATMLGPMFKKKDKWAEKKLNRYDQWCNPVENPIFKEEEEEMTNSRRWGDDELRERNTTKRREMERSRITHLSAGFWTSESEESSSSERGVVKHFVSPTMKRSNSNDGGNRHTNSRGSVYKSCRSSSENGEGEDLPR
ncbi:receptor ionotropic, kainate 3 [Seminavis robusta]|uniref:Receptor ionotropic, kainate 3 n=1 Tax=Seminavis robusta TaxID=568900 RepID=A0A9N8HT81_9STRA|nr:receptor ionotropic, kainate 3 [Seminavis robusta]|eukprot:Sro1626_g286870.1 receptor ionotropic, kainate 3 (766) ;mRNA; r:9909-12206